MLDPQTMQPVPRDGETIGEVMFRGNIAMKGYLKNETDTQEAFAGAGSIRATWRSFTRTATCGSRTAARTSSFPGGENISSIEVEDALFRHPAVIVAAVVAQPDGTWGEVPCAFVELKDGATLTEAELLAHCRNYLAGFKMPKRVVFGPLPKTSTGKIQKFMLRRQANSAAAIDIGEVHRMNAPEARTVAEPYVTDERDELASSR